MSVIIIEGADGVGKTTISKQISEKYNYIYIKESYTEDNKIKQNRITEMLFRIMDEEKYIYDRTTLIDDFVYSFLNKKNSTLIKYKKIIIEILKQCEIFHLELNEEERKKRFNSRGDEYITNDMITKIKNNYNDFYKNIDSINYIELDNNNEKNINEIIRRIKND